MRALAAIKNSRKFTSTHRGTVPDSLVQGNSIKMNEFKAGMKRGGEPQRRLSLDRQMRAQIEVNRKLSEAAGEQIPLSLVVSPGIKSVSRPLRQEIERTGGTITVFDPKTKTFSPFEP